MKRWLNAGPKTCTFAGWIILSRACPVMRHRWADFGIAWLKPAQLSAVESELIRQSDWDGMIRYGVIFFMPEKPGAVLGVSNLHIHAAMRGRALREFQTARNAPDALYPLAGKGDLSWNRSK